MGLKQKMALPIDRIPALDHAIRAASDQALAIGTERQARNDKTRRIDSAERLAAVGVPQAYETIGSSRG